MEHGAPGSNRPPARTSQRHWLWPAVAAGLSLLTLGFLLWNAHQHDMDEHAKDFASDLDSVTRSLDFRVQGTEEYLHLLATEVARGAFDAATFQTEAERHVRDNPEILQIRWTGIDGVVHAAATERRSSGDLDPDPEVPERRTAVQRAIDTRAVACTGLVHPADGPSAVELVVPVLERDDTVGVIVGVLSCEEVLHVAVPRHVAATNRVSLVGAQGAAACSTEDVVALDRALARDAPLASFRGAVAVRLERHATNVLGAQMWLLTVLCVALTLGMAYGLFAQARSAAERQRAQEVLRREHANLVNVLEAMEDGVAVVSEHLEVQYVNPALVKEFGAYEGRKCYEYFHGHASPCSWCMMDEVVAGRTVHTEWCYPRNDKTYDLIDTRIDNPDGTVSKLKMFRDITERVEAVDALRESEQRFHELFERAADAMLLHDERGRIVEVNQAACDSLGYRRREFPGLSLEAIHAAGVPRALLDLLRSPMRDAPTTVLARYRRKDGSTFPVEVRLSWLEYRRERILLASARDITERERAEQAIQKRLEAEHTIAEQTRSRLAESEGLHRVSKALLQKTTLKEVLDVVCAEAQRLTRATGSGVLLLDDGQFRVTNSIGSPPPGVERIAARGSYVGFAVERQEPLFVPDLEEHDLQCYREPRPGSLIVVPLRAWGKIIGVLDVAGGKEAFLQSDTRILSHFADQAAIAIQKARLREQAEQVAVLEERHRLARELHDSVTQSLYSASLYADAAAMGSASGKHDVAEEHLRVVKTLMREALLQMRLLIYELRPPVLEQGGLVGAVEARLAAVEQRAGLRTTVSCDGERMALPARVEEALYGFTLEALNNALKHARARAVEVGIHFESAAVRVEVTDDGIGFDQAQAWDAGGMGLRGMRERLERLGGRLVIESMPESGTRLVAEVAM